MLTATQSFTTLKAIPLADRDTVQVLTRAVDGDNGGGLFRYDAQATNPDDDGLTLAPADGIGRHVTGCPVSPPGAGSRRAAAPRSRGFPVPAG